MNPIMPDEGESFKLLTQKEIEEAKQQKGVIAAYGGSKQQLYGNSHLVHIEVQINGNPFFSNTCIHLKLIQKINADHEFTLTADPGEFDESNAYLLQNSKKYLGSRITFSFIQFGKIVSVWTGLISSISSNKKDGIKKIIIRGKTPAFLMENGIHCRSFENQTLEEIIREVSQDYPKDIVSFDCNPNLKNKLPYTVQYNQNDFQFIKNLAVRYGEYFYYNGEKFQFSSWGSRIVELTEGEDIYDYELKLETKPQKFSYAVYDPIQGKDYTVNSERENLQKSTNPFQQSAFNSSQNLFTKAPTAHFHHSLLHKGQVEIEEAIIKQKVKQQNLVYIEATSNNPELRIGDIAKINIWMPGHEIFKTGKTPIESYRIIEITHEFSDGEGYTNTFIGLPKEVTVPAYCDEYEYPKAPLQHAVVTDNKDPLRMGRVRVQFVWQKPDNQQTPWIQVIQPHAGSGKGCFMNPEIGETVLIAFQGGNAEAPIVVGTAYNGGEIATYYTAENDIKVIQTRSGTQILFNDAEGSILITDPGKSSWFMDGKGNISVNAPNNMNFTVGNDFTVTIGNNFHVQVGNDNHLEVGNEHKHISHSYTQRVFENKKITVNGELTETTATSTYKIVGGDLWIQSSGTATILGAIDARVNKG